jgi:hypothetical protein
VSNDVLAQFGNPNRAVTAQDVATVRQGGPVSVLAKRGGFAVPGLIAVSVLLLGPRHRPFAR